MRNLSPKVLILLAEVQMTKIGAPVGEGRSVLWVRPVNCGKGPKIFRKVCSASAQEGEQEESGPGLLLHHLPGALCGGVRNVPLV